MLRLFPGFQWFCTHAPVATNRHLKTLWTEVFYLTKIKLHQTRIELALSIGLLSLSVRFSKEGMR